MKRVGLVVKSDIYAARTAQSFLHWLEEQGVDVVFRENNGAETGDADRAPDDLEAVFVLGGDGTFLSAVRWIGDQDIPVLGVKFGEVGFLAEVREDAMYNAARQVLSGDYTAEDRMRLKMVLKRNEKVIAEERVLNDLVISKSALARLARVRTEIDGKYLTTFTGDGLIMATPTGSTAYSMAAGGPVVHPEVDAILLTPVCAFTLTNRPLILPDSARISVQLDPRSTESIIVTCDGQAGFEFRHGDELVVERAVRPIRLITMPDQQYFDVLKAKLRWSGERI